MSGYNVKDLAEFMRRAKEKNQPFVIFTGAGCSKSAGIPLASELVKEINQDYQLELKGLSEQDRKDYGQCMAAIGKDERRKLIKSYIDRAKINWAHIVLALLVEQGYIQRIFTFNFDNLLARSCGLLGLYPSTYDFTSANLDLQNLIVDPAIIYLHGQSHGFTQLNTAEETETHADKLSQFVANTLNQSPSIFIGYSGQADAFFPLLSKKFCGQHRLFWIGRDADTPDHVNSALIQPHRIAHYLHSKDADLFFIELARELGCFPPQIFSSPYEHLLKELEPVMDFPIHGSEQIDLLSDLRERLQEDLRQSKEKASPDLEALMMQGKYDQVIAFSDKENLSETDKDIISWAYIMLGNQLLEQAKQTKNEDLYQQSFGKYQLALKINPNSDSALNNWAIALTALAEQKQDESLYQQSFEKYAQILSITPDDYDIMNNWGITLADLAKQKQDESLYQQCFEKYAQALSIKTDSYEALNNWGRALADLAKQKQDEYLYQQCFEKYEQALSIKPDNCDIIVNWGNALFQLAQQKQDKSLYQQSIEKYAQTLSIKPDDYRAINNWGRVLADLAKQKQDESLYQQCFEKYAQALSIKPNDYEIIHNWAITLVGLAKQKQDESLYQQSFEKFAQTLSIKPDYYNAILNWAIALTALAEKKQDESLYLQCLKKYAQALSIKPNDHEVILNLSSTLLSFANFKTGAEKTKLLKKALQHLNHAESLNPDDVYNLACVLCRLNDLEGCKNKLLHCEKANTLPSKQHLLEDSDLDNVRELDWFKALIQRI